MENSREDKTFLPRKFWVLDENAKSCFNCNVNFLPPFRRRHHCRMCGKIYCAKCSDNFLRPPQFIFENEKEIRVCNHCFKLSRNIIRRLSLNETLVNLGKPSRSRRGSRRYTPPIQSFTHATAENPLYNLNMLLSYHLNVIVDDITECLFKEAQLNQNWNDLLEDFIIQALDDIQPDTTDNMDNMDITNYIKIKTIPYQDNSETKYIQGLAIRKNLVHKKMANQVLNPRILMLSGSLDFKENNQDFTNLENLVHEEQEQVKFITKSILGVHPNIVIVEKNVNGEIQEILRENGITVISRLRPVQFGRICRVTGSRYINNLKFLHDDPDKYMGKCSLFKIMNFENHEYFEKAHNYEKGAHFDPSIMKFDGCHVSKGITITISGPDQAELKAVKGCLLDCFRVLRDFAVKKEVILQEIFLYYTREEVKKGLAKLQIQSQPKIEEVDELLPENKESEVPEEPQPSYKQYFGYNSSNALSFANSHLLNEVSLTSAGFLIDFFDDAKEEELNLDSLKNKCAKFTKVNFVILSQEGDLEGMKKEDMQLLEKRLAKNDTKKLHYLAQVCAAPKAKINEFYSNNDTSLGEFIKKKAEMLFTKCEECHRPRYHHTAFFYKNGSYIKVSTEAVGPASQTIKRELEKFQNQKKERMTQEAKNGTRRGKTENSPDLVELIKKASTSAEENEKELRISKSIEPNANKKGSRILGEGLSINDIETSPNNRYESNPGTQSLTDQDQSKKTVIIMYLECNSCNKKVSDEFELSRIYLEYSFTHFLTQLIMSNEGKSLKNSCVQESIDSPALQTRHKSSLSNTEIDSPGLGKFKKVFEPNSCCGISTKSRVFKYQEFRVKFTVAANKVYELLETSHTVTQTALETANQEQIRVKFLFYSSLFDSLMDLVLPALTALTELIMKKNRLEVTQNEIISHCEGLNSDQSVTLLRELLFIKQKLCQVKDDFKESIAKCTNYLHIEEFRKRYFYKISELCESTHQAREEFFLPVKFEKSLQEEKKISFLNVPNMSKKTDANSSMQKEDASNDVSRTESSKSSIVSTERKPAPSGSEFNNFVEENNAGMRNQSAEQTIDTLSKNIKPILTPDKANSRSQTPERIERPQKQEQRNDKNNLLEESRRAKSHFAQPILSIPLADQENFEAINRQVAQGSESPAITEGRNSSASSSFGKVYSFYLKKAKDAEDEKESEIIRAITKGMVFLEESDDHEAYEKFEFIPVSNTEPISAIAFVLNCSKYMKDIYIGQKFSLLEKKMRDADFIAELRDKLLSPDAQYLIIKIRPLEQYFRGFRNILGDINKELGSKSQNRHQTLDFITDMSDLFDLGSQNPSLQRPIYPYLEKISFSKFKVNIYFPQHFQALRLLLGINHADFIQSIACSGNWKDNSGGKTNAQFVKSHDDLYVFKAMKKTELNAFLSIISNYFEHMCKALNPVSKKKTFLARIVGIFEVEFKDSKANYCFLAMENIRLGIKPTRVYDLKGSDLHRLILHPKPGQVLLDTNFKLDQNGEPISVESSKMKEMVAALDNDTLFLSSLNRVDYSLILALDDVNQKYKIGVIDYLQDYDVFKQGEYLMKSVFNNVAPTIVNAQDYRLRFMRCIEKYFMETFVERDESEKIN